MSPRRPSSNATSGQRRQRSTIKLSEIPQFRQEEEIKDFNGKLKIEEMDIDKRPEHWEDKIKKHRASCERFSKELRMVSVSKICACLSAWETDLWVFCTEMEHIETEETRTTAGSGGASK